MQIETSLQRLSEAVTPSDDLRANAKRRLMQRIGGQESVQSLAQSVRPSVSFQQTVKERLLRSIRPQLADDILSLASSARLPKTPAFLRERPVFLPIKDSPLVHSWIKWSAAFALVLVIIRSMPLILLAPPTSAETGVQLLPAGEDVTMFIGGVWQNVTEPIALQGPVMINTGTSRATLVLNDDGVLRLGPNTTLKLHDLGDHPQSTSGGPTATLVRGQVWALGLLPPVVEGLALETGEGVLSLNAGSASVYQDEKSVAVAAYDKGVTFRSGDQNVFLVSGEKAVFSAARNHTIATLPVTVYADPWVAENLSQDAVHRTEIARLQEQRRDQMAGILPTSIFYPAKRIAEQVDVLFTLTQDGRTEKRIQQANTRLSEAIALLKTGQHDEATVPLQEYSQSLVALASDQEDNIVKELIKTQIAEASTTLTSVSDDPEGNIALVTAAVERVGAAIPDAELSQKDIQGYVLVDRLAQINKILSLDNDPAAAAAAYADISPFLKDLLSEDTGAHPLLQKEARSLLVSTSSLLSKSDTATDAVTVAMQEDIGQYLPEETDDVLVSEEELNATVSAMMERIFVFRHPRSRYNQLLAEMRNIEGNPNRGTLLRRLKNALPEGLGEYVNTEIKNLGSELSE